MKSLEKSSIAFISFLQAFGIFLYCSLCGFIIWTGNQLFGPTKNFLGPVVFLALLVASVLICALLAFGYAIYLFWNNKEAREPIKLVSFTACWLAFLIAFTLVTLYLF